MSSKPTRIPNSRATRSDRVNTIGARKRDLEEILVQMETDARRGNVSLERIYARWPFPNPSVAVKVIHPGGNEVELHLACRNLSRGGIALLHSAYMHPGSRLAVLLPNRWKKVRRVEGIVARCVHRDGIIHEIGVTFDSEITLREFIVPNLFGGWLSYEHVSPNDLAGSVLHIEPSKMDQKILGHFLRDTDIRVRSAETAEAGHTSAQSGCDLIICEYNLPDMSGPQLVRMLRGEGIRTPVLMVSNDINETAKTEIQFSGCNMFVSKPFDQNRLLLSIAEFLLGSPPLEQDHIPRGANSPAELSVALRGRLRAYADELDLTLAEDRPIDAYVVCEQIKLAAPTLGFKAIGDRAAWLSVRLSRGTPVAEIAEHIRELTAACRNLRAAS